MKLKVLIERGDDGTYGAYIDSDNPPFGLLGDGDTAQEAIDDFYNSYEEMRGLFKERKMKFTECEFEFAYDVASFLDYYGKVLSLAGLERLTGINQGQLSHYVTGRRKPGKKTVQKIENRLKAFGKDLQQIQFV
ncbi:MULTISPECIES: helix-turn-helix domain-containing protein [Cyclobacterium]|uniref:helix-turn-helix domain-containing protein n=1 Tax=Cyclobacterium TaxID=68288 RepID=UPI0013915880|nr:MULTISPECIES: helix-turn-helix transcriptional regulator [Cyclobacterium]